MEPCRKGWGMLLREQTRGSTGTGRRHAALKACTEVARISRSCCAITRPPKRGRQTSGVERRQGREAQCISCWQAAQPVAAHLPQGLQASADSRGSIGSIDCSKRLSGGARASGAAAQRERNEAAHYGGAGRFEECGQSIRASVSRGRTCTELPFNFALFDIGHFSTACTRLWASAQQ